jgi:hypothetical protein
LDLIKKHKEFSCNIGIINISTVLTKDDFNFYKREYLNIHATERPKVIQTNILRKLLKLNNKVFLDSLIKINRKNKLTKAKPPPFLKRKHGFVISIIDKLSLESIAALCSFYDIGYENLYSEQYEKGFDFYLNSSKYNLVFDKLADGYERVDDIEKGIKKCGQVHLL